MNLEPFHSLLRRQLTDIAGSTNGRLEELKGFIEAIDQTYRDNDVTRDLLERSLEISTQELLEKNNQLQGDLEERKKIETALKESEARYKLLLDISPYAICVFAKGKILFANEATARMLGAKDPLSLVGKEIIGFAHPDSVEEVNQSLGMLDRGDFLKNMRRKGIRLDGSAFEVEINAVPFKFRGEQAILVVAHDITEQSMFESERSSYLETLSLLEEVIIEIDENMDIRRMSDSLHKLVKDPAKSESVTRLETLTHPDYRYYVNANLLQLLTGKKPKIILQFPVPRGNNSNAWLEGKFLPISDRGGRITGIRGVLRDVTLDHLSEKQINFFAYHDALTGLPNRTRLEEALYRSLIRAERGMTRVAVGFIDINNFSQINNSMGYKVGDRVLLNVTERLSNSLGPGENLFRWAGDQYVVLIPDMQGIEAIRELGSRLAVIGHEPVKLNNERIHVTLSAGFAVYPDDGLTAEDLLGQADRALVYAKTHGRINWQLARDLPERQYYIEQMSMRNKVAQAIKQKQFTAFFQPKLEAKTHKIRGFEALARWIDAKGKMISPDVFIPIAENIGMISELGEQVFRNAFTVF